MAACWNAPSERTQYVIRGSSSAWPRRRGRSFTSLFKTALSAARHAVGPRATTTSRAPRMTSDRFAAASTALTKASKARRSVDDASTVSSSSWRVQSTARPPARA